jgi:hypothetical protein
MNRNVEWVTSNAEGLIWHRVVRPYPYARVLGHIVFYTLRGAKRASMWRAYRSTEDTTPRMCFTLREAIDHVELDSVTA